MAMDAGVSMSQVTLSSDSNGSMPIFDQQGKLIKLAVGDIRNLCLEWKGLVAEGFSLEDTLRMVTLNPAKRVGIDQRKGSLEEGRDADFSILSDDLKLESLMAKGQWMIRGGEILRKGTFEG